MGITGNFAIKTKQMLLHVPKSQLPFLAFCPVVKIVHITSPPAIHVQRHGNCSKLLITACDSRQMGICSF